ncbi:MULTISPECIES: DUF305 domain-containing protein [Micrococcaceae]|uniref:DUF305 domain-containing protein n=1 Tax=Micrococcaceae TaxID=1268 RepID=UPI00105BD6E7|nr:DUF305 domain-containing protein [Arthrobacter sp. JUb115]TDU22384.1 uncharacterized protein (DUF305 family) [Arthrobacter sp. JUb115]
MNKQTLISSALVLGATLALAGCAGEPASTEAPSASASGSHSGHSMDQSASANDADMAFAAGMKVHHEQAIEMSRILLGKSGIPAEVASLAERIQAAQAPEIERMDRWLSEWNMPGGMDHGSMDHGDGMVPEEGIKALEDATGSDAARLFLEQMIMHHEGAVEMSKTEISEGSYPAAIDLAQQIVDSQTREITEMKQLLETL